MEGKKFLVLLCACLLLTLAGCSSGPKPVDRAGGVGQLDAGITLVDGSSEHVAKAGSSVADVKGDIDAAGQREAERKAALEEQARILSDGSLSIAERLEKCQELIEQSRGQLQSYIDGSGSNTEKADSGRNAAK